MRYTLALLLFIAAPATAQTIAPSNACGLDTKIFGCVDSPLPNATISRSSLLFQGWALSCNLAQQPSNVDVYYMGEPDENGQRHIVKASRDAVTIAWRGQRPDVLAFYKRYCNITTPNWGYAVHLDAYGVPLGTNTFAIMFTDPSVGIGVSIQQVNVTVVP